LVYQESRYVYVSQEEMNKVKIETALKNVNNKAREDCLALGFTSETTEYADCNLKLSSLYKEEALEQQKIYLAEQQGKKTSSIGSLS